MPSSLRCFFGVGEGEGALGTAGSLRSEFPLWAARIQSPRGEKWGEMPPSVGQWEGLILLFTVLL